MSPPDEITSIGPDTLTESARVTACTLATRLQYRFVRRMRHTLAVIERRLGSNYPCSDSTARLSSSRMVSFNAAGFRCEYRCVIVRSRCPTSS